MPSFNHKPRVTSEFSSSLFRLVGSGRGHNSPRRPDNPSPPLAEAQQPAKAQQPAEVQPLSTGVIEP